MKGAKKTIAIGIDVGATQTRVATVDEAGNVLALRRAETQGESTFSGHLIRLARLVTEVRTESGVADDDRLPVGLALPGTLDGERRTVIRALNIPFLDGRAIGDELAGRLGSDSVRIVLLTDAEAATWGEYTRCAMAQAMRTRASAPAPDSERFLFSCSRGRVAAGPCAGRGLPGTFQPTTSATGGGRYTETKTGVVGTGSARGSGTFVHLRLGTGVACGVVIDGELQRLDADRDGHLDVLVVDDRREAPMCYCGRRGCLEAIASGAALAVHAEQLNDGTLERFSFWRSGARVAAAPCGGRGLPKTFPPTTSATGGGRYTETKNALVRDVGTEPQAPARGASRGVCAPGPDHRRRTANDRIVLADGVAALQSAWENGTNTARDIVGQAADAVSAAISNLAERFHPDVICIGGGVTTHLPALLREVSSRYAPRNDPRDDHPSPRVEPARLGDQAGVIGAALLALREYRSD